MFRSIPMQTLVFVIALVSGPGITRGEEIPETAAGAASVESAPAEVPAPEPDPVAAEPGEPASPEESVPPAVETGVEAGAKSSTASTSFDTEVVGDPTFIARRGSADWSRDFSLKMEDGSGVEGSCAVGFDMQPVGGRLKTGRTESEGRGASLGLAPAFRVAQCSGAVVDRDGRPLANLAGQVRFDIPAGVALSKDVSASLAPRVGVVGYMTSPRGEPEDLQYKGGVFAGINMWGPSIGKKSPRDYLPTAGVFVGAAKKFQVPFTEGIHCTAAGDVAVGFLRPTNGTQTILNHDPVGESTNFGFGYRKTGVRAGVDMRVYCTATKGWKLKWPF